MRLKRNKKTYTYWGRVQNNRYTDLYRICVETDKASFVIISRRPFTSVYYARWRPSGEMNYKGENDTYVWRNQLSPLTIEEARTEFPASSTAIK